MVWMLGDARKKQSRDKLPLSKRKVTIKLRVASVVDVDMEKRQPSRATSASKRGSLCSVRLKENRQIT